MKIALYIEDGLEQIVLTPETATEKALLGKLHDGSRQFELKRGSFYACRGGWVRYTPSWRSTFDFNDRDDDSTMIVLHAKEPESPAAERDRCGAPAEPQITQQESP